MPASSTTTFPSPPSCPTSPPERVRAGRADLVLKRGMSNQGKHVFVGRYLTDDEWSAALESVDTPGDWIVQAYCPPDRLYAPDDTGTAPVEHEAIWGVFGFGQTYGGAFGRLMPCDQSRGVINSARGAKECAIFEV